MSDPFSSVTTAFRKFIIFVEQVYCFCCKHIGQRQAAGRQFLKESTLVQFYTLSFVTLILFLYAKSSNSSYTYDRVAFPPLSATGNGVFSADAAVSNSPNRSSTLYYSPNNHPGVQELINALTTAYPDINAVGCTDENEVVSLYEQNFFNTWAS